jgi:uncharacterized protein YbjT (DUF2867 family)
MTTDRDLVTVFGATGAQGRPVVDRLLAEGRRVRAVGHTPEKLVALAAAGAETATADFADRESLEAALEGASGAFVQLPFVPVEELLRGWASNVARALGNQGIPIAVFTSSGPVAIEPTGVATFDSHKAAVDVLRGSGAPIVFLEPAIYLGNVEAGELRYPPFASDLPRPYVSVEDQAALAVAALGRPDFVGRTLPIGRQLIGVELASAISAALGRPVRHAPMTPRQLGEAVRPMMGDQAEARDGARAGDPLRGELEESWVLATMRDEGVLEQAAPPDAAVAWLALDDVADHVERLLTLEEPPPAVALTGPAELSGQQVRAVLSRHSYLVRRSREGGAARPSTTPAAGCGDRRAATRRCGWVSDGVRLVGTNDALVSRTVVPVASVVRFAPSLARLRQLRVWPASAAAQRLRDDWPLPHVFPAHARRRPRLGRRLLPADPVGAGDRHRQPRAHRHPAPLTQRGAVRVKSQDVV